jgi:hypothetical protein
MSKLKRGRPEGTGKFQGNLKKALVSIIRQTGGISNAQRFLLTTGILIGKRKKKKKFAISFPTLIKIANSAKLKFHRGRPKLEAI